MSNATDAIVSAAIESNKSIIRSFVEAWNNRDFDRFDTLMAEGATLKIGGGVVPCDPNGTRMIAEEWTTAFPDWHFDLLSLIAEGDKVVAHLPYSGTLRHSIAGVAPTNRACLVDEIVIFRIEGGKIAEAWEVYDEAGMWRQLGVAPPGSDQ